MKFGMAIVKLNTWTNRKKDNNIALLANGELESGLSASELLSETQAGAVHGQLKITLVAGKLPNRDTIRLTSQIVQDFALPQPHILDKESGELVVNPAFTEALQEQYIIKTTDLGMVKGKDNVERRRFSFTPVSNKFITQESIDKLLNADAVIVDVENVKEKVKGSGIDDLVQDNI